MKRALLILAVLATGCQGGEALKTSASGTTKDEPTVEAPSTPKPTRLFMIGESALLRLGDDWGDAQKVYPAPKGSFPITELPDQFGTSYEARGWEGTHESFGVILYKEEIVTAMVQQEGTDSSASEKIRQRYDEELASITPVEVKSGTANFTFWEDGEQRLMLLSQKLPDKVRTTVALGDKKVMDALGASVERARQDGQQLDALLKESREKTNGASESGVENRVPEGQGGGASSNGQ